MARIRSIKPEFPQSESMGNVSRDARLTFIQLWTIADDEGRLRGNSRMLASLLFPYDDDAPGLIDGWLAELETEGCIVRYKSGAQNYVQLCNWLIHQKIDKPSKSKIPPFEESSRILANAREVSSEEGIKDQGGERKGEDQTHVASAPVGCTDIVLPPLPAERRREPRDNQSVQEVFSHWQRVMDHPKARLDDKRSKAIARRLADGYSVDDLRRAIDGCRHSPHHMGQNDQRTVYDDIELICRDGPHVDKFIKLTAPAAISDPGLRRQIDVLQEWMETP